MQQAVPRKRQQNMGRRQNRDGMRFFLLRLPRVVARNRLTETAGTKETAGTGRESGKQSERWLGLAQRGWVGLAFFF
jgi:hypothetical protein